MKKERLKKAQEAIKQHMELIARTEALKAGPGEYPLKTAYNVGENPTRPRGGEHETDDRQDG